MRLKAYTIIEGIVSMVLLSILLSIAVIVSFNLYRSFPARRELALKNQVTQQLDSLVAIKQIRPLTFSKDHLSLSYEVRDFQGFDLIKIGSCIGQDSTGLKEQASTIFYVPKED
ncbi:hypothetical protein [Marinoscillum luteum]|uniref:Type II secretion system protein n=1 Tax=Marinoscillum luteum TaxID=861051 RepID=A0ABW7NEI5_9BACT